MARLRQSDVRAILASCGFSFKKVEGEFVAYPKGTDFNDTGIFEATLEELVDTVLSVTIHDVKRDRVALQLNNQYAIYRALRFYCNSKRYCKTGRFESMGYCDTIKQREKYVAVHFTNYEPLIIYPNDVVAFGTHGFTVFHNTLDKTFGVRVY